MAWGNVWEITTPAHQKNKYLFTVQDDSFYQNFEFHQIFQKGNHYLELERRLLKFFMMMLKYFYHHAKTTFSSLDQKGFCMNEFQKFLRVLDRHEKTDFLLQQIFLLGSFFGHFLWFDGSKKMAGAKKLIKVKNQFFHACQPREEIFEIRSYWGLIFRAVFLNFKLLTLFHFCEFFAENWQSDSWGHIFS